MIHHGDCLEVLRTLPENSVDSLVTDPPAGISFMGKAWDSNKGGRKEWIAWMSDVMRECHRVLKPGAHGLVWALPRTSHWTATALEDSGFEVRDVVTHLFGQGFPKSLDISKAIDKAAGAEREVVGSYKATGTARKMTGGNYGGGGNNTDERDRIYQTAPATDAAKQWQGFGTALKPASEHWILVRKPISEKTVAANVLKWGTGGINIDGSRIGLDSTVNLNAKQKNFDAMGYGGNELTDPVTTYNTQGRFPANLVLSHSEFCTDSKCDADCAVKALDEQSLAGGMHSAGKARKGGAKQANDGALFGVGNHAGNGTRLGDSGGASRFFYCAKISSSERNAGLAGMPEKSWKDQGYRDNETTHLSPRAGAGRSSSNANHHPTVKPQKLMRYLLGLVTPPGGTVLDPFTGSGSTGVAAIKEGFKFIGIERESEYVAIAEKRIDAISNA